MRRRIYWKIALAGLALLAVIMRRGERRTIGGDWPVNLAHRGDSLRYPENTLEAFRAALDGGAGGIETDVHLTRDGYLVLIHDDVVDRTTDVSGLVREMTLEEVRRLDAGYWFVDGPGESFRGRGLRVPTLREVYEEFPGVSANVDIKEALPGIEAAVLELVRDAGAEEKTVIASKRHGVVERFRRLSGGSVATAASQREIAIFLLLHRIRLAWLLRPAYVALQVPVEYLGIQILTPRFVRDAHRIGVRVDVWTIDDPLEMRRMLDLGVDVVMTNRPATLAGVISERKART